MRTLDREQAIRARGVQVATTLLLTLGTGCVETVLAYEISKHADEPAAFDHGEEFDGFLVQELQRLEQAPHVQAWLFVPTQEAVRERMVWAKRGTNARTTTPSPRTGELADGLAARVSAKYLLVAAMLRARHLFERVDVVEGPYTQRHSAPDAVRIFVRLPEVANQAPSMPEAPSGFTFTAATRIGVEAYDVYSGEGGASVTEHATLTEFRPRMRDLLQRLEAAIARVRPTK